MNKKEFRQAVAEYELALQIDAKQEKVWKNKTAAHLQLGETDKALEALQKRLELIDQRPPPQAETPEKTAELAAELLAEKTEIFGTMANLYLTSGRGEQAEQSFNEVLTLNPKDETALGWLAEIYATRGGARSAAAPLVDEHLQKALGYYDQVLALNPKSANTYINKRVVMIKYLEHERVQQQVAELEMRENAKKPAKLAEAKARAEASAARMEEFKVKVTELNQKFSEAQKAAKAPAPPPAPAPAPAPAK
jgi:tetratricopeptide (TPR) repeat protein